MTDGIALAVGAIVGVAIFLAGQRAGIRASHSKLESSKAYLESSKAVSSMATRLARTVTRESVMEPKMAAIEQHQKTQAEDLSSIQSTVSAMWAWLKQEPLGSRRRPPPQTEIPLDPAARRVAMPVIERPAMTGMRPPDSPPASTAAPEPPGSST